jgi:hypothetical protein
MEILVPFWYKSPKPEALCSWRNLLFDMKTDRMVALGAARVQPMLVSALKSGAQILFAGIGGGGDP